MSYCVKCGGPISKISHTLNNEALCENCWSEILDTHEGRVAYNHFIYHGPAEELVDLIDMF